MQVIATEKVKLFRVIVNELDDDQHFPVDYNYSDKYFDWSKNLDEKLNEYNTVVITDEDCFEAEKSLIFCEVDFITYMDYEKDNNSDHIDYGINFDWQILKTEII